MMTFQKIKSVIVEDELAAREVLKNYLSKYCPQVEVVGEAQNIKEAVPLLHEIRPQLVFLDVEMPFGNAFDVLEACKDLHFEITYEPVTNEAKVKVIAEYALRDLNKENSAVIPNMEANAERTFTIKESNELTEDGNPYTIDKSSPFTLSASTISDVK